MAAAAAAVPAEPGTPGDRGGDGLKDETELQEELLLAGKQLQKERRRNEKLRALISRQQVRLEQLEVPDGLGKPAASAEESQLRLSRRQAEEVVELRAQAEQLRRRLEAETVQREEELRQLVARHAEDDEAAREALNKVSLSLETIKMENMSLRRALSLEQQEAAERRSEIELLREGLAEANSTAAESERAWNEWADKREGANRLRELREANVRLQEKLSGAESRLEGLRADCAAAAVLAEERGEAVTRLRELLAASEARAVALKEVWEAQAKASEPPPSLPLNGCHGASAGASSKLQSSPRASEQQLAAICDQLEKVEASGRSRQAAIEAAAQKTPLPPASGNEGDAANAASAEAAEALTTARAELAALHEQLARAENLVAELRAENAGAYLSPSRYPTSESPSELEPTKESGGAGGGGLGGRDSKGWRHSGSRHWQDACPPFLYPAGLRSGYSGLWRTAYCTNDLDELRRSCLSLAAERDRLSGDCAHYRHLYEEEQRLRRQLTEEVRRLGWRAKTPGILLTDSENWQRSSTPSRDLEVASFSAFLRHRYTVT